MGIRDVIRPSGGEAGMGGTRVSTQCRECFMCLIGRALYTLVGPDKRYI